MKFMVTIFYCVFSNANKSCGKWGELNFKWKKFFCIKSFILRASIEWIVIFFSLVSWHKNIISICVGREKIYHAWWWAVKSSMLCHFEVRMIYILMVFQRFWELFAYFKQLSKWPYLALTPFSSSSKDFQNWFSRHLSLGLPFKILFRSSSKSLGGFRFGGDLRDECVNKGLVIFHF